MNDDERGGCRGQVPFSWDKIKDARDREHYLGQCLVHEANWWSKAFTAEAVREEGAAAAHRTQEVTAVRSAEQQLMEQALGLMHATGAASAATAEAPQGQWVEAPEDAGQCKDTRLAKDKHSHHKHKDRGRKSGSRSRSRSPKRRTKHRNHKHQHRR